MSPGLIGPHDGEGKMPEMMLVASMAAQVTVAAPAGWMAPRPRVPVAKRPRKVFLARDAGKQVLIKDR